jgi:hypothetical protein
MHLSLLNRGIFSAGRQMYVLSTAMTPDTIEQFVGHFTAALEPIADAIKQATPMAGAR